MQVEKNRGKERMNYTEETREKNVKTETQMIEIKGKKAEGTNMKEGNGITERERMSEENKERKKEVA